MKFEWNETKNKSNKNKHGLHFETAALVFQDPYILSVHDERYIEERWYSLGLIHDVVIYVAHTIKEGENDEEEIIRIITARAATSVESKRYFAYRECS